MKKIPQFPIKKFFIKKFAGIGLLVVFLLLIIDLSAQAPKTLSYQGKLSNGGSPLNGTYNLTFTIYDALTGGTNLWTETSSNVAITNGNVSITLGKITPINVTTDKPLWLGITVSGNPEISPRVELTSSLYSLGIALPFSGSSNSNSNSFEITNTGVGSAARFVNNNPANTNPAVLINQSGSGNAITTNAPIEAPKFKGGSLQLTNGTPGAGKVLTSDSLGVASWKMPTSMPAGTASGEMMYWNGSAWLLVPPGNSGQPLTFCNGVPVWGICPTELTVVKAGPGTGTVYTSNLEINCGVDCSETYNAGTTVTLNAGADYGSNFAGWSGGCSGFDPCVVTLSNATTVTATFTIADQFTLDIVKTGTGTGTVTNNGNPQLINCGADCSETYISGTVVQLIATPTAGSTFAGWSGGGCSGTGTCYVYLNNATTVSATFNIGTQTLSVSKSGSGSGTVTSTPAGINCGPDCNELYTTGTLVQLVATPAAGSSFTGWSGGGCTGTGTCNVTVNNFTSVTATFTANPALNVVMQGTGTGIVTTSPAGISCPGDCTETYPLGAPVTLTASPTAGSTFVGWSGGGCSGTGTCVVFMNNATNVFATFNLSSSQLLNVVKVGNGSGSITSNPSGITCGADCSETYNGGTVVTLSVVANAGTQFMGWSGGGCSGIGSCVVTMNTATTVTGTFSIIQYPLTVVKAGPAAGIGTVTSSPAGINCGGDCAEDYNINTVIVLTATPGSGSTFLGWSGGGCSGTGTCTVSISNATTVTATFQ